MRIHLVTIGEPKLAYARSGWDEYLKRLQHYHTVRVTHLSDKFANDSKAIMQAAANAYVIALVIEGTQLSSPKLAQFLEQRALEGREVCFVIGGPHGLPQTVINQAAYCWSFSKLTLPHDLAMVVLLEAIYRASTITAGLPYHK
jgi:23S rRNA (pseudouridine1915-N3)-methyltransferase